VWQNDAGKGTLLASLAEAAFLIGLEKNRFLLFFFFSLMTSNDKALRTIKKMIIN
jgi:hypothetical protein